MKLLRRREGNFWRSAPDGRCATHVVLRVRSRTADVGHTRGRTGGVLCGGNYVCAKASVSFLPP